MPTIDLTKSEQGRKSPGGDYILAPLFAQETGKSEQPQLFHLLTLQLPSPELPLNLVDSNYDVQFNGTPFTRFPFQITGASMSSDGSISNAALAVANVSREIMYYVEKYNGLSNMRVLVKTVYANVLDGIYTPQSNGSVTAVDNPDKDATAYIEDEYVIDSYQATEQTVTFILFPIIDLNIMLPRRRYMVDSCYWEYGDPDTCKYTKPIGSSPTCNKTRADCKAHTTTTHTGGLNPVTTVTSNEINFGGFPGVSGTRRIIL